MRNIDNILDDCVHHFNSKSHLWWNDNKQFVVCSVPAHVCSGRHGNLIIVFRKLSKFDETTDECKCFSINEGEYTVVFICYHCPYTVGNDNNIVLYESSKLWRISFNPYYFKRQKGYDYDNIIIPIAKECNKMKSTHDINFSKNTVFLDSYIFYYSLGLPADTITKNLLCS